MTRFRLNWEQSLTSVPPSSRCSNSSLMRDQTYWAYNYCPTSFSWLVLLGLVLYLAAFAPGRRSNLGCFFFCLRFTILYMIQFFCLVAVSLFSLFFFLKPCQEPLNDVRSPEIRFHSHCYIECHTNYCVVFV